MIQKICIATNRVELPPKKGQCNHSSGIAFIGNNNIKSPFNLFMVELSNLLVALLAHLRQT